MKHKVFFFAAFLLLASAFAPQAQARAYDLSAVAPSGQTLYYSVYKYHQLVIDGVNVNGAIVVFTGTETTIYTSTHAWDSYALPTGDLVIPDSVHIDDVAYPVVGISQYAFMQCDGLTSVTLPSTLKCIGRYAFYGCDSLESVIVPSTVTWAAIENANGYFGTGIESWTFGNCPQLTGNFTIPNGVTYIGAYAFYNSAITSLTLPSSLRVIGGMAFAYCFDLQGVITLPDSLTAIVGGAFMNCYKVLSINIPDSANVYGFEDYPEYNYRTFSFVNNINWSRNVNVEAWSANGLSVLGARTFNGHIENGLVYRDQSKTEVTGCDYRQNSFSLPTTVDSIGQQAFTYHHNLAQITLPEGLVSIKACAFEYCSGLAQIAIPSTVSYIGGGAFSSCSGLTDMTLPASLTTLGFGAFEGCENLDTLRMMGSVPPMYDYRYVWDVDTNTGDTVWVVDSSLVEIPIVVPCHAGYAYRHAEGWNTCTNIIDPCDDEAVTYTVTVVSDDEAMGSVSEGGEVEEGDSFTISATANEGYHFTHWNDGDTNATRTVVVSSDTTFTAYFEADSTEGIGDVDGMDAKVYSANGQIVVDGAAANTVTLYDAAGRIMATRQSDTQTVTFDVPATGIYLVKVGNASARRIVVVR